MQRVLHQRRVEHCAQKEVNVTRLAAHKVRVNLCRLCQCPELVPKRSVAGASTISSLLVDGAEQNCLHVPLAASPADLYALAQVAHKPVHGLRGWPVAVPPGVLLRQEAVEVHEHVFSVHVSQPASVLPLYACRNSLNCLCARCHLLHVAPAAQLCALLLHVLR